MQALNATDVRHNFSSFFDTVVREKPQMVRRTRDHLLALSLSQAKVIFDSLRLHAEFFQEEDGSITASLKEIDLVVNADTAQEAIKSLAEDLLEYSLEYYDNFSLYFNAPNRQHHFPYIMQVLIQDDIQGVMNLINA